MEANHTDIRPVSRKRRMSLRPNRFAGKMRLCSSRLLNPKANVPQTRSLRMMNNDRDGISRATWLQ